MADGDGYGSWQLAMADGDGDESPQRINLRPLTFEPIYSLHLRLKS